MIGVMARPVDAASQAEAHPRDFDAWMTAEQRRVFLLCYRLMGTRDEADTATQDVFLKAYRALSGSRSEELLEPAKWLTRVAVNTCLDRLRSRRWRFWRQRIDPGDEQIVLALGAGLGPQRGRPAVGGRDRQAAGGGPGGTIRAAAFGVCAATL